MKEEAQGFPTAWGSIEFPLHPKALEVSENEFIFGKSKLTMGTVQHACICAGGGLLGALT